MVGDSLLSVVGFKTFLRDPDTSHNFLVSITFAQGKDLSQRDRFSQSDPYCRLDVLDKSGSTAHRKSTKKPVWNERVDLVFETMPDKATISCFDWDKYSEDDLIGSVELDLSEHWDSGKPSWSWLPIHTVKKSGKIKKEGEIQLQIVCKIIDDDDSIEYFQYTHMMHVVVKEAKGLPKMDYVSENDNYCLLEMGTINFKTHVANGKHPKWNESGFLFVDERTMNKNKMKVSVFDKDHRNDDRIGAGFISMEKVFSGGKFEAWVPLHERKVKRDTQLGGVDDVQEDDKYVGEVLISAELTPRRELEDSVSTMILDEYDADKSGMLDRSEVMEMVTTVSPEFDLADFDDWFDSIDTDKSGALDREELVNYMQTSDFQSSAFMIVLVHQYLSGDPSAVTSQLMEGFAFDHKRKSSKKIAVRERESGLVVNENIPTYIIQAMRLMNCNRVGRKLTSKANKVMKMLSTRQGRKYDDPASISQIPAFISLHSLDTAELEKNVDDFKTFNDFFARAIKSSARPINEPDDPTICVSPADCRMMVFPNMIDSTRFWVKGDKFTIENLLGPKSDELSQRYLGGSMVIARLAPQDYHRWHMPVTGVHGPVTPIKGALNTVNPIAIGQNVNVYTENKRCLVEIDTEEFGKVIMVAVSAVMVGSYHIFGAPGEPWQKGRVHGEFRFGGSTVLVLFEPDRVEFDDDLLKNSASHIETLLKVNTRIGQASRPGISRAEPAAPIVRVSSWKAKKSLKKVN
eukprot:161659_1